MVRLHEEARFSMARRSHEPDPEDFDDDDGADDDIVAESDERETAFCPECGAEIHDSADVCPKCFTWIDGETSRHPPSARRAAEWKRRVVVWILIAAMAAGLGLFGAVALFR
jgi:hypothetical protein